MKIALQALASTLVGVLVFGVALFVPAATFDYWQAWLFIAVFTVCTTVPRIYLAVRSPAALRRRLKAGPTAESRPAQRIIISAAGVAFGAVMVVSALDWRFGWSTAPAWLALVGNLLVAIGLLVAQLAVVQNNYAGSSITVEEDQPLVSTGLYGAVRHPLYSGALIMMIGMPPALGSLWGLAVLALTFTPVIVARILDEGKALTDELSGYRAYKEHVRYRLVPGVW